MNCIIVVVSVRLRPALASVRPGGGSLGQFLSAVFATSFCVGSGMQPAQEGDALDQLRQALQQQQREAEGHHQVHRPADQAAGVGGHLAGAEALQEEGDAEVQDHQAHRRQEEREADDVDPDLLALGQAAGDHVDLHVLAIQQRVARRQQEGARRTGTTAPRGRRWSWC
jgi:hypothetical protein